MSNKKSTAELKPRVVYDARMPGFAYRDDRGEARTVGVEPPKGGKVDLGYLANLPIPRHPLSR